ncbi:hypothetical protein Q5M87_00135 [Brachyspira innocens]|uniref:Uncharacterized protein n=1 Tax=Brachyspira innocens TaxID=13264 RepID=A0ABT8YVB8_9SPIR|nr:hypothetical protein [Brachyspira innocens]MDO6992411.1 hypothetical protein [Brachyspira innocens]MDO7019440.1 hypothetical protein [Brachyspira innocens]
MKFSLKNIELIKFEWDYTYLKAVLNIKNNYPVKIKGKNVKADLVGSTEKKFVHIECEDFSIKAMNSDDIVLNITIDNRETSAFIHNFIHHKKSVFKVQFISGKLYLFSLIPINLSNKKKNIDILDIIKHLYHS